MFVGANIEGSGRHTSSAVDRAHAWECQQGSRASRVAGSFQRCRAQKFTWNADGTPNFGTPVRLGVQLTAPSGE
jgi:GH43 family beta-xylosidase